MTPEIVIFDQSHLCSYLPGRTARLPYRRPVGELALEELDVRLAEGDRRSGLFLYRTQCPACESCQPIRLNLETFRPNATQRREMRRGDALLTTRIASPKVDAARVALFNAHRQGRGLDRDDIPIDESAYDEFLAVSCCQTIELSYWHAGRLVGVAIADAGRSSLSAVYCYYDPSFQGVSIGTYSILKQAELCQQTKRQFLYLGFFIAESGHMSYKARFHPHERLIGGKWQAFP